MLPLIPRARRRRRQASVLRRSEGLRPRRCGGDRQGHGVTRGLRLRARRWPAGGSTEHARRQAMMTGAQRSRLRIAGGILASVIVSAAVSACSTVPQQRRTEPVGFVTNASGDVAALRLGLADATPIKLYDDIFLHDVIVVGEGAEMQIVVGAKVMAVVDG